MNMRKFGLMIGVLLVLAIGFIILRGVLSKDEIQPQLQAIINNQQIITDLSDEAARNASQFELKNEAATVAATTASDNQQLKAFYKSRYRKDYSPPKSSGGDTASGAVADLRETQPGSGYDTKYKELVRKQLETNQASLQQVYNQAKNQQLKELVKTAYNNQNSALEQIK